MLTQPHLISESKPGRNGYENETGNTRTEQVGFFLSVCLILHQIINQEPIKELHHDLRCFGHIVFQKDLAAEHVHTQAGELSSSKVQ